MACSSQLRAKLLQKENEAAVLKQVIQHIKLQAQHSVLRLHVLGVKTEGVIPDNMSSGAGHPGDSEDGVYGLWRLVDWLADVWPIEDQRPRAFTVAGNLEVGSYSMNLGRMLCWDLATAGDLKLSVPEEFVDDFIVSVQKTAKSGSHHLGMQCLAEDWDMLSTEILTDASNDAGIFLVHRPTCKAIVVAPWPLFNTDVPTQPDIPIFDPDRHFGSLMNTPDDRKFMSGEEVEVECNGWWLSGVVHVVEGDIAHIQCDIEPGIIIVTQLCNVRYVSRRKDTGKRGHCNMRSRSLG